MQQVREAIGSLLTVWDKKWRRKFPGTKQAWPWQRGFIQPIDHGIEAKKLFRMPAAQFEVTPCRGFVLTDDTIPFKELLAWPHLHRLDTFSLRSSLPRGHWIRRVQECPGFRNVSKIYLIDSRISVPQLEQLLNAFRNQRIVEL